ncbi:hypothetical protein BT96DRAFT_965488 [Gymnopus androsaceus JB14]|uniref:VLRF1 domain-containing protein n=1 Tax=Gymnopus androsaceus JB14 TaxID=1447944 RepID=A0A6A4HLQ7_9AGAR|nr:hypothetical protein BT96DRAFT_965488 [Gymnopus androsaceus JB14]
MSLHVYSLPQELLQSLAPRNSLGNRQEPPKPPSPEPVPSSSTSATRACNICLGIAFLDIDQQRAHFRSDWHRYNVKNRLKGGQPVAESDFNQLIDGLEDSLSGSESSSDEETESESDRDAVNALVNKHNKRSDSPESSMRKGPTYCPFVVSLSSFDSNRSLSNIISQWYTRRCSSASIAGSCKIPVPGGRQWAMFMVAGGHFAGAVIRVSKTGQENEISSKKPKKPVPETEVLRHKTFHRYTTRRKQGGSQGLNDNAKGNAKSAGAQLRRYGEQALRDDIRNLLADWEEEINECELIFIRATGVNRRIFIDYEGAVIAKGDDRLRTFPFPTRRPTQSELSRCLVELTRVKVSHLTEEALRAQDEAYLASLPKPKPIPTTVAPPTEKPKPKPIKLSKEEEILREKWSRLLEMVTKGRLEPLKAFWEREGANLGGIDTQIPEWVAEKRAATLLQLASFSGQEDVTNWLLEMRADPSIAVPTVDQEGEEEEEVGGQEPSGEVSTKRRQTAYDLAPSRGVRDVFRRNAAAHADWWDWFGAGHVPSALSKEMEDERDEKKKARRKGLKDRVKEREAKEKEKAPPVVIEQAAPPPVDVPSTGPRRLGGGAGDTGGIAGLTPEMRAKIERERRARAAEARMKPK